MRPTLLAVMLAAALFSGCQRGAPESAPITPQAAATASVPPTATHSPASTRASTWSVMPFVDFGFRVVLSGPGQARAGEDVTYTLDYQRVSPNPKGWGNRFVIDYGIVNYAHPPQPPASLVAVQATAGASPTNLVPQIPGFSENCEFVGDSGTLQIIVCPAPGFAGPLTVRLYIKGTSIEFPPGSANEVTTQIGGS